MLPTQEHNPDKGCLDATPKKGVLFTTVQPLKLRNPYVFTKSELGLWLAIGKNSVNRAVRLFDLECLPGTQSRARFSTRLVLIKILGVSIVSIDDFEQLLRPLQKASWVSKMTGHSASGLSEIARREDPCFPRSIQVSDFIKSGGTPRQRRWVPSEVEAFVFGGLYPTIETVSSTSSHQKSSFCNVFEAVCSDNAQVSR